MIRRAVDRYFIRRSKYRHLRHCKHFYNNITEDTDIYNYQLFSFNQQWERCYKTIPFYSKWKEDNLLPEKISRLEELEDWPILTKQHIRNNYDLIKQTPNISSWTRTGGTSGLNTRFPVNAVNAKVAWSNSRLGRDSFGIKPLDSLLLIWGHSHLFGKHGRIKKLIRLLKDYYNNIYRFSAYEMSSERMDQLLLELSKGKHNHLIAYGSLLAKLINHIRIKNIEVSCNDNLVIINTSENLSRNNRDWLSENLDVKVIDEYGMAEAGVIAYTSPTKDSLRVFYKDFLAFSKDSLIISTISDICFPLINYDTEDAVDIPTRVLPIKEISQIQGKARNSLLVVCEKEQKEISQILFDHALKYIEEIIDFQYIQSGETVIIQYTSDKELSEEFLKSKIVLCFDKLSIGINRDFIEFRKVSELTKTIAGKKRAIL